MTITKERKTEVIGAYQRTPNDTGSADVQIAVLTTKINQLTEHLRSHQKDHAGRRGLLMMVSRRRSLLEYVKKSDPQRYLDLIGRLNLRK